MEQSVSVSYKLSLEARYTLGNLLSASYINNVVCNSIKYAKCIFLRSRNKIWVWVNQVHKIVIFFIPFSSNLKSTMK